VGRIHDSRGTKTVSRPVQKAIPQKTSLAGGAFRNFGEFQRALLRPRPRSLFRFRRCELSYPISPTDEENGLPQPSASWVIEDLDVDFNSDSCSILPWEIWGTSVPIDSGLSLFSSDPDYFRQTFHPGRELEFIYNTAEFARSLLNRQRFIPALHRNNSGALEARWRPLLDLPGDQKYFDDLASSAPAVLFAVVNEETTRSRRPELRLIYGVCWVR